MRKLLILSVLLVALGVTVVKSSGRSVLEFLPEGFIPHDWIELVDTATPSPKVERSSSGAYERMVPHYKPTADYTPEELDVKKRLERQLQQEMPRDVVIKKNGKRVTGTLLEETATQVQLQQEFRGAGTMLTWIPRSAIQKIVRARSVVPSISYRDVRYQMDFPSQGLYVRPPFTIVTGKNYFEVETAVELLEGLNDQFGVEFQAVSREADRAQSIQLLFFSEEKDFESYREKYAPNLGYSSGFYSPRTDRLVIYDRQTANELQDAANNLDAVTVRAQNETVDRRYIHNATRWNRAQKKELSAYAEESTRRTLLHEGAHQLFHTYRVHSNTGAEHLWLIEGLAVYCESKVFGARPDHRLKGFRPGTLPFVDLTNFSDRRGFGELGDDKYVEMAYAMSGFMVHFLMQDDYRERFFDFIKIMQGPEHFELEAGLTQFELLSRTLGLTSKVLDERLRKEFRRATI